MGYLLEKRLLSDQLRCFVSSATVSRRAETAKPSRRGKGKNQRKKHTTEQSGQGPQQQDQEQSHEKDPPTDEINIGFSETSVCTSTESVNDVAMVPTVPSAYQPQNLEAVIAAPAGVCSNTINAGSCLGTTSHRSPKRKGFQVKRRSPTDKDAQIREYKEQLTHIVLNNTDFHERIANAINRTLAKSDYHDLNRSQHLAHNQQHHEYPLSNESSSNNVGDGAATNFGVDHPTTASGSNSGSINLGSTLICTSEANNLNYKTPSKRSSAVAQTVSKMLLSDPNYQDIFFYGMGGDSSSTCPARSPSPTSRLLSTPEPSPPQYERPDFYNAAEAASDYLTPVTSGNSQLIAAGLGSICDDSQTTTKISSGNLNITNSFLNSSSHSVKVASHSPVASGSDEIKIYNSSMPDASYNSERTSVDCLQTFNIGSSLHSGSSMVGQLPVLCFTQSSSLCNSIASTTTSYPALGDHSQQASTIDDARKNDVVMGTAHEEVNAASYPTGSGVVLPSVSQPSGYSPRKTSDLNTGLSASSDGRDLQQPSSQLDDQAPLVTTPKPIPKIPRIISKTIPFLDNSACFRQDYDSFSKGTNSACSGDENAAAALSRSATAPTAFANDASPLIPTSVRDALMPILNRRQGSVISIAGTSTTGLGGGLLTVVHIPKDESDGAKTLRLLKPKPIEGNALNGPMTVTLPNEIEVTFQDKIVKKIPKEVDHKSKSPKRPSCKNTKLKQQTVKSEPLARQNKHDASLAECSSNHEDQFEQQQKENGDIGCLASDCPSTDGNSIMLAAIGAALMQDSPDKLAAAPSGAAAANVLSSPNPKATKSSSCLGLSRTNSKQKNRRSLSSNVPQREQAESTCTQQSKKSSDNVQESSLRHEVSGENPSLKFQKRSMSEGTSSDFVRSPSFVRQTRASIRIKTKRKENESEISSALPTVYPFDEIDTENNSLPSLEKNQLEAINCLKTADIACEKTMSAVKTMTHPLNDDLMPKRGSLSTPSYKRRRSYVRVLDFKTPNKSPSNLVSLKERKPRSLFNSPSPNKTKNSALSNRNKNFVSFSKKTPSTKRTLDVISEESINDNPLDKSNDSSPPPTKKLKLSIAEPKIPDSLGCNDLPDNGVAFDASVTSVQSCHIAHTSDISQTKTAHSAANSMQLVSSIETHSPRQGAVPYSMSDYFTTPMKFPADIVFEAPTPFNQGIKSTNKKISTVSKNELNTPVSSQFPPPSPCPKTPCVNRGQGNNQQHFPEDAILADELDLQLIANHNKHNIREDGQSSLICDSHTITEPCDSDLSPKMDENQHQESAISVASTSICEMSPTSMGIALERELQTSLDKSNQALMNAVEEDGNIVLSHVTVESEIDGAAVKECVPVLIPKVAIALPPSMNNGSASNTDAAVQSLEDIVDSLESGETNLKGVSCSETKKSKKKKKDKKEGKKNKSKKDKSRDLSEKEHKNKSKKGKKEKKCKKTTGDAKARKSRKKESLHETENISNVGSVPSNNSSCLNMSYHSCASNKSPEKISCGDQVPDTKFSRVSGCNKADVLPENEHNQMSTPPKLSPLRSGDTSVTKKLLLSASKVKVVVSPLRKKHGKLSLSKSLWKSPKSSKKEAASPLSDAITMRNLFGCTSDDDWEDDNEDDLPDLSVLGTDQLKNRNNTSDQSAIQNEFEKVTNYSREQSLAKINALNCPCPDDEKKKLNIVGSDNSQISGVADNIPTQNDTQKELINKSSYFLPATIFSSSSSKEVFNEHTYDGQDRMKNLLPKNNMEKITSNGNEASNHNKPNSSCSSEEGLSVSSQTKNVVKVMSSDSAARKIVDSAEASNPPVDGPVRRSTRRKIPKNVAFPADTSVKSKQTKSKKISDELIVSEIEVNVLTSSKVRRIAEKLDTSMEVDEIETCKSRQESLSNKKIGKTASDTAVDSATQESGVSASTETTKSVAKNAFNHWGSSGKLQVVNSPCISHEMDAPAAGSQSPADVWEKWTTALSSESPSPFNTARSSTKQNSPSSQFHGKAETPTKSLEFIKKASTSVFPVPSTEGKVATPIAVKRLRCALQGGTSTTAGPSRSQPQSPLHSSSLLKQSFARSPCVTGQLQDDDQLSDSYLELDSQLALLDGPVDVDEEDNVSESCSFAIPTPGKHLASFTPLPKTPEKEMRHICRSMVKDGIGAMVAVPSSQLQLRGHNVMSLSMAASAATATKMNTQANHSSSVPTSSGVFCAMNILDNNSQLRRDSRQGSAPCEVDDEVREISQKLTSSSTVVAPCIDYTVRNNTKELLVSSKDSNRSQEQENSVPATSTCDVDRSVSQNGRLEDSSQITTPGSPNIEDDDDQEYSFVLSYSEFMNLTEINVEDGRLFLQYPLPCDNVSEINFSDHQRNLTSMQDHESKSTVDEVDLTEKVSTSNDVRGHGCLQDGMKRDMHDEQITDNEDSNKKANMNTGPENSTPQCKGLFFQQQPVASAEVITSSTSSLPSHSRTNKASSSTLPCASKTPHSASCATSVDAGSGCGSVACGTSGPCPASGMSSQVVLASSAPLHPLSAPGHVQVNVLRARAGSSGEYSTTSSASSGHLQIAGSSSKPCNWSPPGSPLHCEDTEASGYDPQNVNRDMESMTVSRQVKKIDNGVYSNKETCALTIFDPPKGFSSKSRIIIAKPLDFGNAYSKTNAVTLNASKKRVRNKHESDRINLEKDDKKTHGNLSVAEEVLEADIPNSRKSRHRKSKSSNRRCKKRSLVSTSGDAVDKKLRTSSSSSSGKRTAPEQPVAVEAKENFVSSGSQTGTNTCAEGAAVGSLPESVQQTDITDARHREPLVEYGSDWQGLRPVPPTPGKFLFTSPPCGEVGVRLSATDGSHNTAAMAHLFPPHHLNATPRHHTWPNPFTSTPMSSGFGSSFASQDAMIGSSAKFTTGSSIENRAGVTREAAWSAGFTVARSEASSDPGYLDRPPKTPGFIDNDAMQGSPSKRAPVAVLGGFNNCLPHQTGSKGVPPSPEKNLDCSSLSEISAPAESEVVKTPHRLSATKGAIVLPKKTKEEMAKFIEMFHKKCNKK